MTYTAFLSFLTAEIERIGSQRKAAREWNIDQAWLRGIRAGRRPPTERLLNALCISDEERDGIAGGYKRKRREEKKER